jgi:hypothetical protein
MCNLILQQQIVYLDEFTVEKDDMYRFRKQLQRWQMLQSTLAAQLSQEIYQTSLLQECWPKVSVSLGQTLSQPLK